MGRLQMGSCFLWFLMGLGPSSPLPQIAGGCVPSTELVHTATAWWGLCVLGLLLSAWWPGLPPTHSVR